MIVFCYNIIMHELVALLAPGLIALGFYNHLHRNKLSKRKLVTSYGLFVVLINLGVYLVTLYLFGQDEVAFDNKSFINYLFGASIFAFLMPFVVNLIENTVSLEVKRNAKR